MRPQITNGWVLFHAETGRIWDESFSTCKENCWAFAKEFWAAGGETRKNNPDWKPVKAQRKIIVL